MRPARSRRKATAAAPAFHHNVYVVLLDDAVAKHPSVLRVNPKRNPAKPCVYVGMSGLPPEHRFENHKHGYKSAWTVRIYALLVTLAQLVVAIAMLAPEGPLFYRYTTLIQHDSYWFENIIARGYQTTVPPINHKMMEVSNTAFFPAYPMFAGALHYAVGM